MQIHPLNTHLIPSSGVLNTYLNPRCHLSRRQKSISELNAILSCSISLTHLIWPYHRLPAIIFVDLQLSKFCGFSKITRLPILGHLLSHLEQHPVLPSIVILSRAFVARNWCCPLSTQHYSFYHLRENDSLTLIKKALDLEDWRMEAVGEDHLPENRWFY